MGIADTFVTHKKIWLIRTVTVTNMEMSKMNIYLNECGYLSDVWFLSVISCLQQTIRRKIPGNFHKFTLKSIGFGCKIVARHCVRREVVSFIQNLNEEIYIELSQIDDWQLISIQCTDTHIQTHTHMIHTCDGRQLRWIGLWNRIGPHWQNTKLGTVLQWNDENILLSLAIYSLQIEW